MTLQDALLERGRPNSLNFIRLVLATAVIVGHSWPLGGFDAGPLYEYTGFAVPGFFCISGFLIAASRTRLNLGHFYWNRALRIMPAFWVCLIVTAVVFAPISALFSDNSYRFQSGLSYVVKNSTLYMFQFDIADTLTEVPYPGAWNGSLWTLAYEGAAYIAAGLLLTGWFRKSPLAPVALALLGGTLVFPWAQANVSTNLFLNALDLGLFFLAGMLMHALARRIPVRPGWAATAAALLVLAVVLNIEKQFVALPLAYLVLWAGVVIRPRWAQRHDISYGMYVYAFPVQQLLALAGAHVWGWWAYVVLSTVLTVPLAWASWLLVERPTLALKKKRERARPSISAGDAQ